MIKSVGYAYATSTFATCLGRAGYYIEQRRSELSTRTIALHGPFDTVDDARRVARDMEGEWSAYTR